MERLIDRLAPVAVAAGAIALFASRVVKELRVLSLEFPLIMGRPPVVLPSHIDVEQDVGPVGGFIESTNAIIMENHGVTTLGATLAEAYYRLNTLAAEVRRVAQAETLAAASGSSDGSMRTTVPAP